MMNNDDDDDDDVFMIIMHMKMVNIYNNYRRFDHNQLKIERKPMSSIMQHLVLNRGMYIPSFHSRVAGFMMPNNSLFVTALGLRSL
jgi:hypothetical protein